MFGAGSIATMIQSIKSNRALLKEKSKVFENRIVKNGVFIHNKLQFKQATPEEMRQFREKLKAEKRREDLITYVIWTIGLIVLALGIYLMTH
jgi:hypothetical protein